MKFTDAVLIFIITEKINIELNQLISQFTGVKHANNIKFRKGKRAENAYKFLLNDSPKQMECPHTHSNDV